LELGLVESASVRWDVGRIAQVLDNLVENSRRYTDAPGTVRITGEALAAMYRIRVDDSPPGVASDELELLFEPLYRGDAARTRGGEPGRSAASTGLGLAIVKAMVEAHGGQISARNSDLGGLRMEVLLPWQAPNATDALPTFSPTRIAPPSGLKESQDEYLAKQAF
jgi:two-component system sensor histidine kinase BaeS